MGGAVLSVGEGGGARSPESAKECARGFGHWAVPGPRGEMGRARGGREGGRGELGRGRGLGLGGWLGFSFLFSFFSFFYFPKYFHK